MKILNPLYRVRVYRDRPLAQSGEPYAMFNYALDLENLGQVGDAEEWYWKAAQAGDIDAMGNLVELLIRTGRMTEGDGDRITRAGVIHVADAAAALVGRDSDTAAA